jgi:PAS domain S-box-containing protein
MKLRITLKTKIAMGIIFATLVFGASVSITVSRTIRQAVTDLSMKYLDAMIVQQKKVVETVFDNSMAFSHHLALQQSVIDYLQKTDPQAQDPALLNYFIGIDADNRYQAIYVMDKTGLTLTSTDPSFVNQNYGFRDYFKKALSGTPAVDAAIGVTSGKFGYFFAHPVTARSGEIIGVVVVKLKAEELDAVLRPQPLSGNGKAMLVDGYGVIIQSDRPEVLYKSLGAIDAKTKQKFIETRRFNNIDILPLQYDVLQRELGTLHGERSFTIHDVADAQNEIIGMAQVDGLPFFIVIEESSQGFADVANKVAWLIIVSTVVVGGMGALLLWLLIARLLRPIDALKNAAIRIGKGDLDQPVPVTTHDELGALGDAFNLMAEHLKDFYANLEGKVWERTADFEKYKLAVDGASDHIIITDIDGRIMYANKAAEEITGYSREEMVGNRPTLWGRQMPPAFYEQLWRTIKEEKKAFSGEVINRRKSGEKYTAELHITPLFMNKKTLYGFVAIERDITTHKEVDRAKTEFVSIASHQLRTPLAVINWYIEMLASEEVGPINKNQRKYLDQVYLASKRMVDLVNSLLSVSRIDLKTFYVEPEPLDFRVVADSVLEELGRTIAEKQLTITKEYESELPLIEADPSLLRVIFQNLLSNAIKYTPKGGSIDITIKKIDNVDVMIGVADTGYGIPLQQQKQIFQKFFRADNAREKEPDGNGLGLYIVKSIVEHANGTIRFVSKENEGTTFYVQLPLAGMPKKEGVKPLGS